MLIKLGKEGLGTEQSPEKVNGDGIWHKWKVRLA